MSKYNFKQNDFVAFDHGVIEGYGSVVGVATSEFAILGRFYMIQVHNSNIPIPSDEYPFTTIAMPECAMVKLSIDYKMIEIDDVQAYPVSLGDHVVCYLKCEYLMAVRSMPEPERSKHVERWTDELFAAKTLPSKITKVHLHQFMRNITRCGK